MSSFKLLYGGLFVLFSLALEGRLLAQCDLYPIFLSDYQCNDNGTPSDPSDDTFTFNITMTNIGTLGNDTGNYNEARRRGGFYLILHSKIK